MNRPRRADESLGHCPLALTSIGFVISARLADGKRNLFGRAIIREPVQGVPSDLEVLRKALVVCREILLGVDA